MSRQDTRSIIEETRSSDQKTGQLVDEIDDEIVSSNTTSDSSVKGASSTVPSLPKIFSGDRRLRFAYLVANGIGQAGVAVVTALLVQLGFDDFVTAGHPLAWQMAMVFGGGLGGMVALGAWLRWRGHLDAEKLGQDYVHAVRMRLFHHITNIGADGARQMSRGAIMLRFVGDLTALRQWVSLGLARLTVSGLAVVLAIAVLGLIEPVIAVSVAIAVTISMALAFGIGPYLRDRTREARRRRGRLATPLNDRISRIAVVEAFGQEDRERSRFGRLSQRLMRALIDRARVIGLLRALSEASAGFASMCALFVGAIEVNLRHASPGAVVAAMTVAGLLATRLQDLGRVYEYWNGALIARRKQEQLLELRPVGRPATHSEGFPLEGGPGRLELCSVSRKGLFADVTGIIEAGSRAMLMGPNGAGKSTLLRMMAGLVHPDEGKILLDGQDISECRWKDVRRAFAIASPELPLLRGSLRLNLTYGAKDPPESFLKQVLADCSLEPLIDRLPRGLDTRISEDGGGLSTGECARIALARALLVRPRVLLLDEIEANLDNEASCALDRAISFFQGTVVFITHDAARAARASCVLRLEGGCLVAMKHPEALMASS